VTKTLAQGIKRRTDESNLRLLRTIEYVEVTKKLVAYKVTRTVQFGKRVGFELPLPKNFMNEVPSRTEQGFALKKDMLKFIQDEAAALVASNEYGLVTPRFLKAAQEDGYPAACDKHYAACDKLSAKAFDLLVSGKATPEQVVRFDSDGHMLFDRNGQVLPTAVHFEYIMGRTTDGCYDLPALVKHLEKDTRVRPVSKKAPGQKTKLRIEKVPYYNEDEGCRQFVPFIFSPTADDMKAMWKTMQKLNKEHPSTTEHQAVFELDLLGLRKAKIARSNMFYGDAS
jgi:hypothetical protein